VTTLKATLHKGLLASLIVRPAPPCCVRRHSHGSCSQLRHSGNQRRNPPPLQRELAGESRVCQRPSHAAALRKSSQL
jgi:hypothetical protein